jgi:transcriptional regulator with XRE-family HTH domain
MEDIRQIVSTNLIKLRKKNNLTQVDLSNKINYSDNAISRWEKGEVLPSLEILQTLSLIYDVQLSYFIEEHEEEQAKIYNSKKRSLYFAVMASAILSVLSICALLFLFLHNYTGKYYYTCFIWAAPIIAFIVKKTIKMCYKEKMSLLTASICSWTSLAAIYFQWFSLNIWPVFLIGMPVQITLILLDTSKRLKVISQIKNKKK